MFSKIIHYKIYKSSVTASAEMKREWRDIINRDKLCTPSREKVLDFKFKQCNISKDMTGKHISFL